jgi:hypothetical protein
MTAAVPRVFFSYSHQDKPMARAIVRRLTAHGVDVWLDEADLPIGSPLTASVREHIATADLLLVLASTASAKADWVAREIAFASEHGKAVVPIFVDPVEHEPVFRDHVGIDATSRPGFAEAIDRLMGNLFATVGRELPTADPEQLRSDLQALGREEPSLTPLIAASLDHGVAYVNPGPAIAASPFHALDHAVNALYDVEPTERRAFLAAECFATVGAGARALAAWIADSGTGGLALVRAVGEPLDRSSIEPAIQLLTRCDPPNNHALYTFIHRNGDRLSDRQREGVRHLVTWPARPTPAHDADVLGWVALNAFPGAPEILAMWTTWIDGGHFDQSPELLAGYVADANRARLAGHDRLARTLQSHVRACLRSADEPRVFAGLRHVRAVVDKGADAASGLVNELNWALGCAEWSEWKLRDPEPAGRAWTYASEYLAAAEGKHDWLAAEKQAEEYVDAARVVDALRRQRATEPGPRTTRSARRPT